MALSEEDECCVCFVTTPSRTPCLHVLCKHCWNLLRQKTCPICRRDISSRSRELPQLNVGRPGTASGLNRSRSSPALGIEATIQASASVQSVPVRAAFVLRSLQADLRGTRRNLPLTQFRAALQPLALSPAADASPPSPLPLARRSSLSPRTPTSPTSPQMTWGRTVGIADLIGRINRVALAEVSQFIHHIVWLQAQELVTPDDGLTLCRFLRKRTAQLVGITSLRAFGDATDAMITLKEQARGYPALEGDGTPRRALESRLGYFAHHPPGTDFSSELQSLERCHLHAVDCHSRGLVTLRTHAVIMTRLKRWVELASMVHLRQNTTTLCRILRDEPAFLPKITDCLQLHAAQLQPTNVQLLQVFMHTLKDMSEQGVDVLSLRLEELLVNKLVVAIEAWSIERLSAQLEANGAVMQLCLHRNSILEKVRAPLTSKLTRIAVEICASLATIKDLPRVQQQLEFWSQLVRRANVQGLFRLDLSSKDAIIGALAECDSRCIASPELVGAASAVQGMQYSMLRLMNEQRIAA